MNARLPFLALLLFSLCCVSIAARQDWSISGTVTDHLTSMSSIVGMGSIIGMILAVIAYYIAITTEDERGKSGAIGEIKSTLINIFLFAIVIGMILSIDSSLFLVLTGQSNGTLITETTRIYENNINSLTDVAIKAVDFHTYVSQLEIHSSSISTSIPLPWGFSLSLNTGKVTSIPVFGRLDGVLMSFITTVFSISSQQAIMVNIMRFFVTISCSLLLPLGFFLRAIPYLRRVGSTLVSIGIALIMVYPISLYVLGSIFFGVQDAAIVKEFDGKYFDPASIYSEFRAILKERADKLVGLAVTYGGIGTLKTVSDVYIKGSIGIMLMVLSFIPVTAAFEKALEPIMSIVIMLVDILLSLVATGVLHGIYEIMSQILVNYMVNNGGVEYAVALGMDLATYGTIVNMTHILILASVVLSVMGFIRALAVLLGGEFFLYGVQDYI